MTEMMLKLEDAKKLEASGIVEFKGFSGVDTDAETAFSAPMLCQMHSLAGEVFNLEVEGNVFTATKVEA